MSLTPVALSREGMQVLAPPEGEAEIRLEDA